MISLAVGRYEPALLACAAVALLAAPARADWPCESTDAQRYASAIHEARQQFDTHWLDLPEGRFTTFTIPPARRNPFDTRPREALDDKPIGGFVQVREVRCTIVIDADAGGARLLLSAGLYRFHEGGSGWSRPLREGVLAGFAIAQRDGAWTVQEQRDLSTVVMAEAVLRPPAPSELPARAAWREPVPGCRRGTRWNGNDCVARRRK